MRQPTEIELFIILSMLSLMVLGYGFIHQALRIRALEKLNESKDREIIAKSLRDRFAAQLVDDARKEREARKVNNNDCR